MTLAARFEAWAHRHEQKGLEKGIAKSRQEGEARILQRLLVTRFGPLSQEMLAGLQLHKNSKN